MEGLSKIGTAILAGGLGTRLRSVVSDKPKVLAEVCGRPFLAYLLDRLDSFGVRDVVICTGYLGEQVRITFGDSWGGLHLDYSHELTPQGTAGALRYAASLLASKEVLVMNGDSFCEVDLQEMLTSHFACGMDASILLTRVSDTSRYGRVCIDTNGRILSFDEKKRLAGHGWINAGVCLLNQSLFRTIPVQNPVSLERDMFPMWVKRGIHGYLSDGPFIDIGTPESYRMAQRFFATE